MTPQHILDGAPEGATHYIDEIHYMKKDENARWWTWDKEAKIWTIVINFFYFGQTCHLIKPLKEN